MDDRKLTVVDDLNDDARRKFVDESMETALERLGDTLGDLTEGEGGPLMFEELEFHVKISNRADVVKLTVIGARDGERTENVHELRKKNN